MSYNFKKIMDLELVNEVPEGANVLIETDGATKRLPSTAIKPAPIQSDMAQNDSAAPDYIKNRTHYEETTVVNEPLNITWDGNTEGLVSVANMFFKVSDIILTDEQIASATVCDNSGQYSDSYQKINDNISLVGGEMGVMFVNADNVEMTGFVIPEAGIYFIKYEAAYIASLTTTEPVEHTKTVVKKLDKKFLPNDIGGGIKYVTISESSTYEADLSFAASASFDQILTWIKAGMDVICIFQDYRYRLNYTNALSDINTYIAMAKYFEFSTLVYNGELFMSTITIDEYNGVFLNDTYLALETK